MKTEILKKKWNEDYTHKVTLIKTTIEIQTAPQTFYTVRSTYMDQYGNTARNDYDFDNLEAAQIIFEALKDIDRHTDLDVICK